MKTSISLRSFQTRCWLEVKPRINNDIYIEKKEVTNEKEDSSGDLDADHCNNECTVGDNMRKTNGKINEGIEGYDGVKRKKRKEIGEI